MDEKLVVVGRIAGLYGVKGWVKVTSYTEPRKNILAYRPWCLERAGVIEEVDPTAGREQGKGLIAQIAGVEDRDAAAAMVGKDILVSRELFAQIGNNEYYWHDLVGLRVMTNNGVTLGVVDSLLETGANDVLVVTGERRRLIPFVIGDVIKCVDLAAAIITVDWNSEF
ncbi:MAG TPA: ribosome maturation factor RimM [Gammaproteobacteria bacterium]|nr:ribosome maturation factor RimM [Chromatiales bacterium]MCP4924728.1 ribosome maturation factor RimM [Gammaproteobacteria bacterium]MDP7297093.1 ribosome maturation factor RimM [Gammaproteobacteria bacterium]MDP7659979.1 ribosome maturation factor RimM [Gammaproteobacteria bacterium]HJP38515.1 ribosome maturation factor RimM [Gammaproteobacteria bacterium]